MNLSIIKEGDQIIAPAYLHDSIREQLLQDTNGIANITIQTLPHFFNVQQNDVKYEYYRILQTLAPQLKNLQNSVTSLSFIEELQQVITHMKQFAITPDAIASDSAIQKEIHTIISQLYPIELEVDQILKNKQLLQTPLHNVYIIQYYSDLFEHNIIEELQRDGATLLNETNDKPQTKWYYALNKRCEIESIAQYIIENKWHAKDIKFTLLDSTYVPYIHLLFTQYQIPYTLISDNERSFIQNKFIALLDYYQRPSWQSSIDLVAAHLYTLPYAKQAIEYMRLYELDLHDDFHIVSRVNISNDVIDGREVKRLLSLEEKAIITQNELLPLLLEMEKCPTVIDVLCFIDNFLIENHKFTSMQDRRVILQIREEIKAARNTLKNKEDIPFFKRVLENIKVSKECDCEGIQMTNLTHPLPFKKYHFILGATQKNYPAMKAQEGLFDESFYESINYPTLQERYQLHMDYITQSLNQCESSIGSYPLSSFDGKANEASLELEQFYNQKPQKFALIENYIRYQRTYTISEQSAKQLFIKDNVLHGSVSSLERYANCPYSYFLRYGLKIEEPIDYSFSNAKAGTLNHYLLETLCRLHSKQYVEAKKEEVAHILNEKVEELICLYPNKQKQLQQMQQRLLTSIMQNLKVLKEREEHSTLTPTKLEEEIHFSIPFQTNYELKLKGFIDRIDMNNDFFLIIDYKSSPKTLKEEQVFAALQLQLITYLVIIEKQYQLRPLGAFYYSFANPNINMDYAKLKRRPLGYEIYKESDGDVFLQKEKKLSGWITSEYIEVMDDDGSHTKGVRNSKASGINTTTIYNSQTLYTYIIDIYTQLANAITSGHIECKSVSNACTYCPYASVCANANHAYTKEEMVEVDEQLYVKGGRKNA